KDEDASETADESRAGRGVVQKSVTMLDRRQMLAAALAFTACWIRGASAQPVASPSPAVVPPAANLPPASRPAMPPLRHEVRPPPSQPPGPSRWTGQTASSATARPTWREWTGRDDDRQ